MMQQHGGLYQDQQAQDQLDRDRIQIGSKQCCQKTVQLGFFTCWQMIKPLMLLRCLRTMFYNSRFIQPVRKMKINSLSWGMK
jgi:hypothetical protein